MLEVNQTAPDFTLPHLNNGTLNYYAAAAGASVLIFYKHTCGTSRFTLPFLQKIYESYGNHLFFAAVAQDEEEPTRKIQAELGLTMPILLDLSPYPVSRAYGLHTVPSIFYVDENRTVLQAIHGFAKQDILNLADALAEKTGLEQIEIFDADVPEFKPG